MALCRHRGALLLAAGPLVSLLIWAYHARRAARTSSPVLTRAWPPPAHFQTSITLSSAADTHDPLVRHVYTADPAARVFDGRLWIYTSHDQDHIPSSLKGAARAPLPKPFCLPLKHRAASLKHVGVPRQQSATFLSQCTASSPRFYDARLSHLLDAGLKKPCRG